MHCLVKYACLQAWRATNAQVVAEITKVRVPTISELDKTWLSLDGLTEQTITNTAKVTRRKYNAYTVP